MSYKTILVHVDDSRHLKTRVDIAAKIAIQEEAHLIGAAVTGIARVISETAMTAEPAGIAPYLDDLRIRAEGALQTFETLAQQYGVSSSQGQYCNR